MKFGLKPQRSFQITKSQELHALNNGTGSFAGFGTPLYWVELDQNNWLVIASKKDKKAPQYKQVVSTKLNLYCVKIVLLGL